MRKSNRQSIEDFDEDDMPCPCTMCNEWFDLNDGKEHPRKENQIICASCANAIQIEVDREEEIEELQSSISDAEYTIKDAQKRLKELGVHPIEGETQEQKSLRLLDEYLSTASKEELQADVDTVNEMYPDIPHAHHNAPIIAEFTQVPIEGVEREWISVEERLPEPCDKVTVALSDGCVLVGRLYSNGWSAFFMDGEQSVIERQVTHWQPLPSPPKNG